MEIDKKSFKKMFPKLCEEIEAGNSKVDIHSVRTNSNKVERKLQNSFRNYDPSVIDFLRRCDTKNQARKIIAYLEKRGELNKEYAAKLRKQLKNKGLRSFGTKKKENYYFKHSELC